jgi:hypothetical protein
MALAPLAIGAVTVGCGNSSDPKVASVTAGPMPANETWAGVYFNPVFGYMHVVENGDNVVGRWKRTDQSKWGEMQGTKTGNVVHFTWTEHTYGVVGPSANVSGKGYFVYKMGEKNIPELKGEYGLDSEETGSAWDCVKQQNMQPDLNSINGDTGGTAPPAQTDKWD